MPRPWRFLVLVLVCPSFLPVLSCGPADRFAAGDCDCAATRIYEWADESVNLTAAESSVFSTDGEDGVIEKIFSIIEPTTRFAVEFGAGNGVRASNTRRLIIEEGWSSLQIEGDPGRAKEMKANFRDYPKVTALEAWVWPGNVELLFEENGVPYDLDLLVIDIDSNDYYVWRAIHDFRPKVVLIEVQPAFPPPEKMVIDFHPMTYWDYSGYRGASLQSLTDLARKKGYELIHHFSSSVNAVFVDATYLPLFGVRDNSPEALYNPPSEERLKRLLPMIREGNEVLLWKNVVIKKKVLHHR